MEHPMEQKPTKRKWKTKVVETSPINNFVQDTMDKKIVALEKLAQLKHDKMELKEMEIIMKFEMSEEQLEVHENYSN